MSGEQHQIGFLTNWIFPSLFPSYLIKLPLLMLRISSHKCMCETEKKIINAYSSTNFQTLLFFICKLPLHSYTLHMSLKMICFLIWRSFCPLLALFLSLCDSSAPVSSYSLILTRAHINQFHFFFIISQHKFKCFFYSFEGCLLTVHMFHIFKLDANKLKHM